MSILETHISKVTVYPSKALVVREGKIKLPSGKTQLEVTSLPIKLDPSSVRAKGSSITGTMIEGIDIQVIYHKKSADPDQKLLDKLEEINDQLEEVEKEETFLAERLANNKELEANFVQDFSRYYSRGEITLEKFNELRSQIADEHKSISQQKKELEREKKKLERDAEIVENKIANRNISSKPNDYTVFIHLNNPSDKKEDEFELELSYVISNAKWSPTYDFRGDLAKGEIVVDYFGMVQQNTGEDWLNIDLVLSTASPTRITTIPELTPWYINIYSPPSPQMHRARSPKAAVDSAKFKQEYLAGAPPPPSGPYLPTMGPDIVDDFELEREEAKTIEAAIEDTGEAQTYIIPKKETIPSEKRPHQVLIAQITNPLTDDFITIPASTSEVIHRGKMVNESEFIFLPGEVRLFNLNEFIGKTRIEQIAPTEKFRFALGTSGKIKVKRQLSGEEVVKKGMIAKTKQIHKEVTIEITNNRKDESLLIVKDRFPLSRHEDIKVKVADLTPTPTKQTDMNICTWKLNLKPGEKTKIIQVYDIEYPVDMVVQGL